MLTMLYSSTRIQTLYFHTANECNKRPPCMFANPFMRNLADQIVSVSDHNRRRRNERDKVVCCYKMKYGRVEWE